jgi:peptidoglycan/LPS O-acetylase OafA/YrhL
MIGRAQVSAEKIGPAQSGWLDLLRWLSAFAVLINHLAFEYTNRLWAIPVGERSLLQNGIQFASGFAHQAVIVFFVLSGFLIGTRHYQELADGESGKTADYLIRRFARLWAVVIPALLLTAALDRIGSGWLAGAQNGFYTPLVLARRADMATLACNSVFLQTLACYPFGTNRPLWSLANEAAYYVLFPLIVFGWKRRATLSGLLAFALVIGVLLAASLVQRTGSSIGIYIITWLVGVVAARLQKTCPLGSGVAAGLFVAWLLGWRVTGLTGELSKNNWPLIGSDLVLASLLAVLFWAMRTRAVTVRPPFPAVSRFLAASSFSLYAIHVPVFMVLGAFYIHLGFKLPVTLEELGSFLLLATTFALVVAASALFALATERQTRHWQRGLHLLAAGAGRVKARFFRQGA